MLPTTARISVLKYKDNNNSTSGSSSSNYNNIKYSDREKKLIDDVEEVYLNSLLLQGLALVDTPGTNAIITR